MKMVKAFPLGVVLALLVHSACAGPDPITAQDAFQSTAPAFPTNRASLRIPAADTRFHYEGRIDFSDPDAPVIIWQASRIRIDFEGNAIRLLFDDAKGQNYFNAQVDGSNTIIAANAGRPVNPATLSGFGPGRHHLELFKRSEATAGTVRFQGIEIPLPARVWAPPPPHYRLVMEFIGDSITAGACNEDGPADQWDNRRTHNCALSYATLTANAFSADYRNISVSGMGIAIGWVPMKAGEIWDRLYPDTNSPPANLHAWTPDIVLVNFGENDGSYPAAHGQSFPTNFTANYVGFIRAIQTAYPEAHLVLLCGGMFNGARNESLHKAWESAVAQLEATDKNVSHFIFQHWTSTHPRAADDCIMADELNRWLETQNFMQAYRN